MTPGARARGSIAAVLLSALTAAATPAAAEPPGGAESSPGGQASAPPAVAPELNPARRETLRRQARPSAEDRLQRLAKGLKLDAAQQAKVRRVLQAHREAIRRLMSAPADSGISRVAAIRAISSQTVEQIRAVLNDEQKKFYSQPLPPDYAKVEGKPSVEEWQTALRRKGG